MLNLPQTIAFGGAYSLRGAISDPFNRCQHITWTGSIFEFVVEDEDGAVIDELHTISGGVDALNAGWWSFQDYGDDVDAIFNLDIPQVQTAELEFQSAKYTLWVTYPSGLRYPILIGSLMPEDTADSA
jgi:hypothetical protein